MYLIPGNTYAKLGDFEARRKTLKLPSLFMHMLHSYTEKCKQVIISTWIFNHGLTYVRTVIASLDSPDQSGLTCMQGEVAGL